MMRSNKRVKRISQLIIVGFLLQLSSPHDVRSEPATIATTAIAYVPMLAYYATGIVTACLAKTQNWSKGMSCIAQEAQQIYPSLSVNVQNEQIATSPTVITATASQTCQQQERISALSSSKLVSPQDVARFRTGLSSASNSLSTSLRQRIHNNWQKMRKPQNFHIESVPSGVHIAHIETGLNFKQYLDINLKDLC